jgi:hypothetical protein
VAEKNENVEKIVLKLRRKRVTVTLEWEKAPASHCTLPFSNGGAKTLSPQENQTSKTTYILK